MSAAGIDLRLIENGDRITVQDYEKNRASGTGSKMRGPDGSWSVVVEIFGVVVEVARSNRNGTLIGNPDARVVGHQPPLDGLDL